MKKWITTLLALALLCQMPALAADTTQAQGEDAAQQVVLQAAEDQQQGAADAVTESGENQVPEGLVVAQNETATFQVTIRKTNEKNTDLAGAQLWIADASIADPSYEKDALDKWTTSETPYTTQLPAGNYKLYEKTAPEGYKPSAPIEFTVGAGGELSSGIYDVDAIVMTSEPETAPEDPGDTPAETFEIVFNRTDAAGVSLAGATLQVVNKDDKIVALLTTETDSTQKVKLEAGTYTVSETATPDGYQQARAVTFEVSAGGEVTVGGSLVTVVSLSSDTATPVPPAVTAYDVKISRTDTAGTALAGARLRVVDANKNEVSAWISAAGESQTVSLTPGTYTLSEVVAPTGYRQATGISFTVDEAGGITVAGKAAEQVVLSSAKVETTPVVNTNTNTNNANTAATKYTVKISRLDNKNAEIAGATLKVTDKDKNEYAAWTSEKGKSYEVKLAPGTYTLTETKAPTGYQQAAAIAFIVTDAGKVTVGGKEVDKVTITSRATTASTTTAKTSASSATTAKTTASTKSSPKTGDPTSLGLWVTLAAASAGVGVAALVSRKKSKHD